MVVVNTLHKLLIAFVHLDIEAIEFFQELLSAGDPVEGAAAHAELGEVAQVEHVGDCVHRLEVADYRMRILLRIIHIFLFLFENCFVLLMLVVFREE